MLQKLIDIYEELKKYIFIINRGDKEPLIIKFNNGNFYHLVGLHKTNINMFFPDNIKSQDKRYKFLKKNIEKFDNILENQIKGKDSLELRILSFDKVQDILKGESSPSLYDLHIRKNGSVYDGDYGLLKVYQEFSCLLGLKVENKENDKLFCVPQSWMASTRSIRLTEGRRTIYIENIIFVEKEKYINDNYSN